VAVVTATGFSGGEAARAIAFKRVNCVKVKTSLKTGLKPSGSRSIDSL
jgi:hypothetical protein